jgi:hypothetical protein
MKWVRIFACVSLLLAACGRGSSIPEQTTSVQEPKTASDMVPMFQALSNTFFTSQDARREMLSHQAVYIEPTYQDSDVAVPREVIEVLAAHTRALGLTQVDEKQLGALVLTTTPPRRVDGKSSFAMQIGIGTHGQGCGDIDKIFGYEVAQTSTGWQAAADGIAVC